MYKFYIFMFIDNLRQLKMVSLHIRSSGIDWLVRELQWCTGRLGVIPPGSSVTSQL